MKRRRPAMNQLEEHLLIRPGVLLCKTSNQNQDFAPKQKKDIYPLIKEAKTKVVGHLELETDKAILSKKPEFEKSKSKYKLILFDPYEKNNIYPINLTA